MAELRKLLHLLTLVLALLGSAQPGWCAWTKTNDKTGSGTANPTSTAAFAAALTNPSLLIVNVNRVTNAASTPTDTAGHTFVDCGAGPQSATTGSLHNQCFYSLNTATTASNVISTADGTGDFIRITAVEFTYTSGNTVSVDVFSGTSNGSTGVGGGQNETSGSATTTVDGDLVIGGTMPNAGALTVGTGFTTTADATMEFQVQSVHGSIAATWHNGTNSDSYSAVMAAFKSVAPGGVTPAVNKKQKLEKLEN